MKPEYIILHHSLTEDSRTVSWQAIRRYHKSWAYRGKIITEAWGRELVEQGFSTKEPWRDIGYHYGIELINDAYEILLGRMPNDSGAHCIERAMNHRSLGVCFIGNFDEVEPPVAQYQQGLHLVRWLMQEFGIPLTNVVGHRYFAGYKTCPGKRFSVDEFRRLL